MELIIVFTSLLQCVRFFSSRTPLYNSFALHNWATVNIISISRHSCACVVPFKASFLHLMIYKLTQHRICFLDIHLVNNCSWLQFPMSIRLLGMLDLCSACSGMCTCRHTFVVPVVRLIPLSILQFWIQESLLSMGLLSILPISIGLLSIHDLFRAQRMYSSAQNHTVSAMTCLFYVTTFSTTVIKSYSSHGYNFDYWMKEAVWFPCPESNMSFHCETYPTKSLPRISPSPRWASFLGPILCIHFFSFSSTRSSFFNLNVYVQP